jgi:hypothetical protein
LEITSEQKKCSETINDIFKRSILKKNIYLLKLYRGEQTDGVSAFGFKPQV